MWESTAWRRDPNGETWLALPVPPQISRKLSDHGYQPHEVADLADDLGSSMAVDAAVHSRSRGRRATELPLAGGGGTAMTVGIETALLLRPRPQLIVVVTDGFTNWPTTPIPVPVTAAILGLDRNKLPPTPEWLQRLDVVR